MNKRTPFEWRGLIPQLFAFFILPLTTLALLLAFGGLYMHRMAMRTLVAERDSRAARAAAALIGDQLTYRQSLLAALSMQAFNEKDFSQREEIIRTSSWLTDSFSNGIAFLTARGDLQVASGDPAFWENLKSSGELSRLANLVAGYDKGAFITSSVNSNPVVLVVSRASSDGTTSLGAFPPDQLIKQSLDGILGAGAGTLAFVTDGNGGLIYQSGEFLAGEQAAGHPGVGEALNGESGAAFLQTAGGEHAYAYSPVQPVGWALVFEEPWEAVASPMLRTTENAPLVLIPVLVLAMLALWYGARRVVRPLQNLESKAAALGWGDYDPIEEPVGGIAEIQRLQNELIDLAHKVRAAQAGLRGYIGAMTEGQEEERRRLARDLHDDTLQSLIALNQRIQLAQMAANGKSNPDQIAHALGEIQSLTDQSIQNLRRLTRALRPPYLEELGLPAALEMLGREGSLPGALHVEFHRLGAERRLTPPVELSLYRITQEALSNVTKHARATHVNVDLQYEPEYVLLEIKDNGAGFVVPDSPAEFAPSGHYGFLGMHERAESIGARLTIASSPGKGAQVSVFLDTGKLLQDSVEVSFPREGVDTV